MAETSSAMQRANAEVFRRFCESDPVLEDIRPALEVLPKMTPETILTSGPPMRWSEYSGGQRDAIIGGALFEGLARDRAEAERKLDSQAIRIGDCHGHGAVGSVAGIYTASMPVFVVRAGSTMVFTTMASGTGYSMSTAFWRPSLPRRCAIPAAFRSSRS
jgi:hypothetical protein